MEKKRYIIFKGMIACVLFITSCLSAITNSFAYEYVNVGDYPTNETVTYNGKATYSGSTVGDFSIGGKHVFCLQHSKTTPSTGTHLTSKIYQDEDVKKVLYYGYNGIEPWSGFTDRQQAIVITSLALSYFYSGTNTNPSAIKNFMSFINSQSVPDYALSFSKSNVSAYKSGNIQRTESITLESGSSKFGVTLEIPSAVTYVDETHGTNQTGGSIEVKGQTRFHFEAPLNVVLDKWTSGAKTSSYAYQTIISEPSSSSIQTIGRGEYVSDKDKTTSLSVDWLKLGSIEINKTDMDNQFIDGAIFKLWNNQGYNQTLTVKQGSLRVENLLVGDYYLQEQSAPEGYLLDETIYTIKVEAGNNVKKVIKNQEPVGEIRLKKQIDSDVTDHLLGDVYLKDIEFGLYAKENIQNASKTKTYYTKDQLVSKQKTNDKGEVVFSSLHLGNYYVKELQSNPSLILNNQTIDVFVSYQNMSTSLVIKDISMTNKIASQRIQIFKEGTKDGETGVVKGLAGAEFTFVLNNDYESVGFEKAKKYFIGTTDENGFLTTSPLPYGVYRVKETKTPSGYYGASDFLVTIDKDASLYEIGYQMKKVTVNNLPFESLLKVIKLDQETGKVIQRAGASFKIKNLDTNQYVSYKDYSSYPNQIIDEWTTHIDGSIILNTKLKVGHYQLEETKAPQGYLINKEPVLFEITEESYEIAPDDTTPLTIVKLSDQAVKGRVKLYKHGEVLDDYQDGKFIYISKGLGNVKFEIKAKEDIVDPSLDGTVIFKKGEVVETLITQEDGYITSIDLPLGKYTYQEVETLPGYVLDSTVKDFELIYQNQEIDLIEEMIDVENIRQKVSVEVAKKDEENSIYLDGAQITLYANRPIYNYRHDIIVEAGTAIETIVSSKDGVVSFSSDLPIDLFNEESSLLIDEDVTIVGNPHALFMMKETQPPLGYLVKKVQYYIDTTHNQQEVISYNYEFLNKKTPVETLGDEPVVETEDQTILLTYVLMGIGALTILSILMKTKNKD